MKLSDKKKIAEVMFGWDLDESQLDTFYPLHSLHYWDILEAMTPEQRGSLKDVLWRMNNWDDDFFDFDIIIWINNNREAVIKALLEVIG